MIAAVPIFTWTGFYVGLSAGWGWSNDDSQSVIEGPAVATPSLAGTLDFSGGDDYRSSTPEKCSELNLLFFTASCWPWFKQTRSAPVL